MIISYLNF